jgi:hypothetical protein
MVPVPPVEAAVGTAPPNSISGTMVMRGGLLERR